MSDLVCQTTTPGQGKQHLNPNVEKTLNDGVYLFAINIKLAIFHSGW